MEAGSRRPPPDPSLAAEYRDLVAELGLGERVPWQGFVNDRNVFLASLDVLIMPSECEGFGMVAAEAMAHGVPVIVPRQSGIAPLVEQSGGGIVVERPDPERIHEALGVLAGDPRTPGASRSQGEGDSRANPFPRGLQRPGFPHLQGRNRGPSTSGQLRPLTPAKSGSDRAGEDQGRPEVDEAIRHVRDHQGGDEIDRQRDHKGKRRCTTG